jgi:hypothetical protein
MRPAPSLQGKGRPRVRRSPEEVLAWLDSLTLCSERIPQLPEEALARESFYRDQLD